MTVFHWVAKVSAIIGLVLLGFSLVSVAVSTGQSNGFAIFTGLTPAFFSIPFLALGCVRLLFVRAA